MLTSTWTNAGDKKTKLIISESWHVANLEAPSHFASWAQSKYTTREDLGVRTVRIGQTHPEGDPLDQAQVHKIKYSYHHQDGLKTFEEYEYKDTKKKFHTKIKIHIP